MLMSTFVTMLISFCFGGAVYLCRSEAQDETRVPVLRHLAGCCWWRNRVPQWGAGGYFWELVAGVQLFFLAFNLLEILLPSLIQ